MALQILKDLHDGAKFAFSRKRGGNPAVSTTFVVTGAGITGIGATLTAVGAFFFAPLIVAGLGVAAAPVMSRVMQERTERRYEAILRSKLEMC